MDDGTSLDENENGLPDECETWTGDLTGDCRVVPEDYAIWLPCFTGPGPADPPEGCDLDVFRASDSDHDWDVDLVDFSAFARRFASSGDPD